MFKFHCRKQRFLLPAHWHLTVQWRATTGGLGPQLNQGSCWAPDTSFSFWEICLYGFVSLLLCVGNVVNTPTRSLWRTKSRELTQTLPGHFWQEKFPKLSNWLGRLCLTHSPLLEVSGRCLDLSSGLKAALVCAPSLVDQPIHSNGIYCKPQSSDMYRTIKEFNDIERLTIQKFTCVISA